MSHAFEGIMKVGLFVGRNVPEKNKPHGTDTDAVQENWTQKKTPALGIAPQSFFGTD